VDILNLEMKFIGVIVSVLEPEELICEECNAEFTISHEMGMVYIAHYCPFCGHEIPPFEEKIIDYEEDIDTANIH